MFSHGSGAGFAPASEQAGVAALAGDTATLAGQGASSQNPCGRGHTKLDNRGITGKGTGSRGYSSRPKGKVSKGSKGEEKGRQRSKESTERRALRGFARRAERALQKGEDEPAREPANAPVSGQLTTADALRLQSRPQDGSALGWGGFLDDESYVPEGLPTAASSSSAAGQVWSQLKKAYPGLTQIAEQGPGKSARLSYLRDTAESRVRQDLGRGLSQVSATRSCSDSEETAEETEVEREEPRSARADSRVIPPTEWDWTEPAISVRSARTRVQPATESSEVREQRPLEVPRAQTARGTTVVSSRNSNYPKSEADFDYESRGSEVGVAWGHACGSATSDSWQENDGKNSWQWSQRSEDQEISWRDNEANRLHGRWEEIRDRRVSWHQEGYGRWSRGAEDRPDQWNRRGYRHEWSG